MSKPHREVSHTEKLAIAQSWITLSTTPAEIELGDNVLHVQLTAENNSASVSDAIVVGVFPLTDDGDASGAEDDAPAVSFLFTPSTFREDERTSFQVADWARVMIKVKSNGATDTYDAQIRTKLIPRRP